MRDLLFLEGLNSFSDSPSSSLLIFLRLLFFKLEHLFVIRYGGGGGGKKKKVSTKQKRKAAARRERVRSGGAAAAAAEDPLADEVAFQRVQAEMLARK